MEENKSITLTREDFLNEVSNEWHKLSWEEFQKVSHLGGEAFNTGHSVQVELAVELEATERWYLYQMKNNEKSYGEKIKELTEHWSNRYVIERDRNMELNNTIAEKDKEIAEHKFNRLLDGKRLDALTKAFNEAKATIEKLK